MNVQNKVVVLTGGGSGLGRELVLHLLAKQARVVAIDINQAGLLETLELAGNRKGALTTLVANVTDKTAVAALPQQIIAQVGAIDGLINNAGVLQPFVKLNDLDYEAIDKVMNVNFYGTLYMVKAFLPHLLTRPQAHIINISSLAGLLPIPAQGIYGASKAAVKLLTETLHAELADTSVKVTVVHPGAIETNLIKQSGITQVAAKANQKTYKMLSPVKAAELITEAMERDQYRVVIGGDAKFMDKLYRLNPYAAAKLMYKQMRKVLST